MATIPAHHPKLPFVGRIHSLYHGSMIRVQGTMSRWPRGSEKFTINLQCEPNINPLGDVPLHVDVRMQEQIIVRNHHIRNLGWGPEERYGGFPLQPGQEYEILILAMNTCYKIAINGQHFCEFNHRLPMSGVQYVYVSGDTTVNAIRMDWDSSQGQVPTAPPIPVISPTPSIGYIPNPTHYVPSYTHPPAYNPVGYNRPGYNPPSFNPQGAIHQPILTSPPYNQYTTPASYGSVPPSGYGTYPTGSPYGSGGGPVMMNKEYLPFTGKW